jgi:hypothetical protein
MKSRNRCSSFAWLVIAVCVVLFTTSSCAAQENQAIGLGKWVTVVANIPEAGFRRTDFFQPHYNTGVFWWESRAEIWLPPSRSKFSWGPYLRFAGIVESETTAYPNALLGAPGVGLQLYPLSSGRFREPDSKTGQLLGPLRLFGEYNWTHYLGNQNIWRPRNQSQVGFDYWNAVHVNELNRFWWVEIWNGLYWQSSNEFTDRYDSVIFANSWRYGIRRPNAKAISAVTPYISIESSRTKYNRTGRNNCVFSSSSPDPNPCNFYWENGLLAGGGIRFAPPLGKRSWLSRFVVYGEYLNTAMYYGPPAPSSIPRWDFRFGVSASFGDWYSRR